MLLTIAASNPGFHNSRKGCENLALCLYDFLQCAEERYRDEAKVSEQIADIMKQIAMLETSLAHVPGLKRELTADEAARISELAGLQGRLQMLQAMRREFTVALPGESMLTEAALEEEFEHETFYPFNPHNELHRLLLRGIGVHHAGLPAAYRKAVERLFRTRSLGLVVSTSTLALGINMPSKTSVFAGDSIHLSQMQFQQEAGRAGRRGFDLRGHTVFFGLCGSKVQMLLRGELPVLRGNLPLDASLALRLALKAQSVGGDMAALAAATQRLLRHPLFCPSDSTPLQRTSEFCFYIQQLQRDLLLGPMFEATDFAGFVAHIFWQQPGNFALVSLLHSKDLLKQICSGPREELVANPLPLLWSNSFAEVAQPQALKAPTLRSWQLCCCPPGTARKCAKGPKAARRACAESHCPSLEVLCPQLRCRPWGM